MCSHRGHVSLPALDYMQTACIIPIKWICIIYLSNSTPLWLPLDCGNNFFPLDAISCMNWMWMLSLWERCTSVYPNTWLLPMQSFTIYGWIIFECPTTFKKHKQTKKKKWYFVSTQAIIRCTQFDGMVFVSLHAHSLIILIWKKKE